MGRIKMAANIEFYEVLTDLFCDIKLLQLRTGEASMRKRYLDRISMLLGIMPDQSCDYARKLLELRKQQQQD